VYLLCHAGLHRSVELPKIDLRKRNYENFWTAYYFAKMMDQYNEDKWLVMCRTNILYYLHLLSLPISFWSHCSAAEPLPRAMLALQRLHLPLVQGRHGQLDLGSGGATRPHPTTTNFAETQQLGHAPKVKDGSAKNGATERPSAVQPRRWSRSSRRRSKNSSFHPAWRFSAGSSWSYSTPLISISWKESSSTTTAPHIYEYWMDLTYSKIR